MWTQMSKGKECEVTGRRQPSKPKERPPQKQPSGISVSTPGLQGCEKISF